MSDKRFKVFTGDNYGIQSVNGEVIIDSIISMGDADVLVDWLNDIYNENEQLKKQLREYTDAFDCSQCRFHNYDWFDDGDEFEVCDKGNNEQQMEYHSCKDWEEL